MVLVVLEFPLLRFLLNIVAHLYIEHYARAGTRAQQANSVPVDAGFPNGPWFEAWLPDFQSSLLLVALEFRGWLESLGACAHLGVEEDLGSQRQIGSNLVTAAIWGVNHQMQDHLFRTFLHKINLSNKINR